MLIYMFRDYDRINAGKIHAVDKHIARTLCRGGSPFGFPATEDGFAQLEALGDINAEQLTRYARSVGLSALQPGLRGRLVAFANGLPEKAPESVFDDVLHSSEEE